MKLIPLDDPRLDHIYQGVQQTHKGVCYRRGVFKDGSLAYVDGAVNRTFRITDGTFKNHDKHVMVQYGEEPERLCREEFKA